MARAKKTDRAEARRRYRAAASGQADDLDNDASEVPAAASSRDARRRSSSSSSASTSTRPARLGFVASLKLAVQPANVREDLRAFPGVALHSKAVWLPGLLVLVSGVVLIFAGISGNSELTKSPLVSLAAQLFIVPPPMIPVFIAGMLAPRGAYLAGFVVGLLSAVLFSIYALTATIPDGTVVAGEVRSSAILYALVVSPLFGLAIGAFAGFYRRFLRMAQPSPPKQNRNDRGRPAARRS